MKVAQLYLVAATLLFGLGQAKTLLDYANEIPACGVSSILDYTMLAARSQVTVEMYTRAGARVRLRHGHEFYLYLY